MTKMSLTFEFENQEQVDSFLSRLRGAGAGAPPPAYVPPPATTAAPAYTPPPPTAAPAYVPPPAAPAYAPPPAAAPAYVPPPPVTPPAPPPPAAAGGVPSEQDVRTALNEYVSKVGNNASGTQSARDLMIKFGGAQGVRSIPPHRAAHFIHALAHMPTDAGQAQQFIASIPAS